MQLSTLNDIEFFTSHNRRKKCALYKKAEQETSFCFSTPFVMVYCFIIFTVASELFILITYTPALKEERSAWLLTNCPDFTS